VLLTEKSIFLGNMAERNIYLPGPEGRQGVSLKAKYIVHAGCAGANHMTPFPMLTEENFWLFNNN